jgi:hypothetical protein
MRARGLTPGHYDLVVVLKLADRTTVKTAPMPADVRERQSGPSGAR